MCQALEELMKDVIEEREQQATHQATQNSKLDDIQSLMSTLKLTPEQAMNALRIPAEEQSVYLQKMQQD